VRASVEFLVGPRPPQKNPAMLLTAARKCGQFVTQLARGWLNWNRAARTLDGDRDCIARIQLGFCCWAIASYILWNFLIFPLTAKKEARFPAKTIARPCRREMKMLPSPLNGQINCTSLIGVPFLVTRAESPQLMAIK